MGYLVLFFGLLAMVAYRSFVGRQASWDLLALVVIGGVAGTAYRLWQRALTREALLVVALTFAAALVVAVLVAIGVRA